MRVLSVPECHVYVRHLGHPDGEDHVVRLPDPPVPGDVPAAQWWPPPALEAAWVRRHHDSFDVFHLHFGFDARTPDDLNDLVAALREQRKPLVYTVHDLRNPHHLSRGLHDAQLDILVPAADALITLTNGAADEIEQRWGRTATVLPHPHVVSEPTMSRARKRREEYVVGVHLKSLRASMDPVPVLETLIRTVATLPDTRLVVNVHTDVVTRGSDRFDVAVTDLLRDAEANGTVDLAVHDFLDDEQLWDYLQGIDLSVLPYRFGTHSGWLEACHDLGTAVLAPDCGYYRQQRPCLTYHLDEHGLDVPSLEQAVVRAVSERPSWRAEPVARRRERIWIAESHRHLYAHVLATQP
ncbi:MAG: glycosyltransferase [Nocardioidaceae bacterium]|nr:glycosyltransferase [Nocardioidaceae bacterium]